MATYDFDRFDTSLNAAVLLSVSLCLMITAVEADLDLSALFWLPFAFFAGAVQLLAGVVFGTQGFSLIWCALLGVGLYEEVRWHRFSSGPTHIRALAVLATVLAAVALVLYAVEELVPRHATATVLAGCCVARPCHPAACWARAGSTLLHAVTLTLAAALTSVPPWRAPYLKESSSAASRATRRSGKRRLCPTPASTVVPSYHTLTLLVLIV